MALKFSYTGAAPTAGNTVEYHLYRLFSDNPDAIFVYPAGVKDDTKCDGPVFGFEGQSATANGGETTEGDFEVTNFDHGCFAWKRHIPVIDN